MEHGIKELNKLLQKFESMSTSEYLSLYEISKSKEKIEINDNFIDTTLSFSSPKYTDISEIFQPDSTNYLFEKQEDSILQLDSDILEAA